MYYPVNQWFLAESVVLCRNSRRGQICSWDASGCRRLALGFHSTLHILNKLHCLSLWGCQLFLSPLWNLMFLHTCRWQLITDWHRSINHYLLSVIHIVSVYEVYTPSHRLNMSIHHSISPLATLHHHHFHQGLQEPREDGPGGWVLSYNVSLVSGDLVCIIILLYLFLCRKSGSGQSYSWDALVNKYHYNKFLV